MRSRDNKQFHKVRNPLDIINPVDGRVLYSIRLEDDFSLRISAGVDCVNENGDLLDGSLMIKPHTSNVVYLSKPIYSD